MATHFHPSDYNFAAKQRVQMRREFSAQHWRRVPKSLSSSNMSLASELNTFPGEWRGGAREIYKGTILP